MTDQLEKTGRSAQETALVIWKVMSVGPIAFFLWLLVIGLLLLFASYGIGPDFANPQSDGTMIVLAIVIELIAGLPPILAIILGEIMGAIVANRNRDRLAGTVFESHATSAIRTCWIMFAGFGATIFLMLALLAIPNIGAVGFGVGGVLLMLATLPLLFLWKSFRVFRGWRRAKEGRPIADHPTRWS
jgi:uncharacterized membrane protein